MFIRIVKMSFEPEKVAEFEAIFNRSKNKIRNQPGCLHLELLQDKLKSNIFMTYSYWNEPMDLENYRNSELFNAVWSDTKKLFNDKPQAWSVDRVWSSQEVD